MVGPFKRRSKRLISRIGIASFSWLGQVQGKTRWTTRVFAFKVLLRIFPLGFKIQIWSRSYKAQSREENWSRWNNHSKQVKGPWSWQSYRKHLLQKRFKKESRQCSKDISPVGLFGWIVFSRSLSRINEENYWSIFSPGFEGGSLGFSFFSKYSTNLMINYYFSVKQPRQRKGRRKGEPLNHQVHVHLEDFGEGGKNCINSLVFVSFRNFPGFSEEFEETWLGNLVIFQNSHDDIRSIVVYPRICSVSNTF